MTLKPVCPKSVKSDGGVHGRDSMTFTHNAEEAFITIGYLGPDDSEHFLQIRSTSDPEEMRRAAPTLYKHVKACLAEVGCTPLHGQITFEHSDTLVGIRPAPVLKLVASCKQRKAVVLGKVASAGFLAIYGWESNLLGFTPWTYGLVL